MQSVSVSIAGAAFTFRAAERAPLLASHYTPFIAHTRADEIAAILDVAYSLPSPGFHGKVSEWSTLWSGDGWRLRGSGCDHVVETCRRPGVWETTAATTCDFSRGRILEQAVPGGAGEPLATCYPTDRVVIVNRLTHMGRIVLHAGGVVLDGKAYVFCGRSEVGKSTMAELWCRLHGAHLLNDDRIVLRVAGEVIEAFAAPWCGVGRVASPASAPLGGIFHLAQAEENRIDELALTESAAALLATSAVPFYNERAVHHATESAATIARAVRACRLAFRPEAAAVAMCRAWAGSRR